MKKSKNSIDVHIRNIVQQFEIKEQAQLQKLLLEEGLDIPQATLSRYIKKLNIIKISGRYQVIGTKHVPTILNIKVSEDSGLVVLHTHPGNASALAVFFDEKYIHYPSVINHFPILGSIAGDDTVLLILKYRLSLKEVVEIIKIDFPYINQDE
ncbi:arginine repressor [Candidatus Cyrtobacter comes]|nr:ArgR family transcriptional regulator [Candidatus Cyrtobacter comes]